MSNQDLCMELAQAAARHFDKGNYHKSRCLGICEGCRCTCHKFEKTNSVPIIVVNAPKCNDCQVNPSGWGKHTWTTASAYCLDCASKPGVRIFRLPRSMWNDADKTQYQARKALSRSRIAKSDAA